MPFYIDPPYLMLYPSHNASASGKARMIWIRPYERVEVKGIGPINVSEIGKSEFEISSAYVPLPRYCRVMLEGRTVNVSYLVGIYPSDLNVSLSDHNIYILGVEKGRHVYVNVTFPSGNVEEMEGTTPNACSINAYETGEYWISVKCGPKMGFAKAYFKAYNVRVPNPPPYLPIYLLTFLCIAAIVVWADRFKGRGLRRA